MRSIVRPERPGLLAAVCLLACFSRTARADEPRELRIHHLDIEQGDATLIVSPDGHALLFDAGQNGMGAERIVPRLRALGITSLDYTVASHYDADHIGGLDEVIDAGFRPIVAYDRGSTTKSTPTYLDYVAAAGARRRTLLAGEMFTLGAEVLVQCVAVNGTLASGQRFPVGDDENASSVALVVRFRGFDYFVAGDLTAGGLGTMDVESWLGPFVRDLDVYRVCHHGSNTSTSATFLARALPEVAVISCGASNMFGHPHQDTLDRLTRAPSVGTIWCTNAGSAATSPKLRVASATFGGDGEVLVTTAGLETYAVNGVVYPLVVDAAPPTFLAGPTADTTRPAAMVVWTTSEPAEAIVEYGPSAAYGATNSRGALATNHAIAIPGLAASTTYHYRVGAIDSTGNASWSSDLTFTTSSAATWRGVVLNEVAPAGSGGSEWVELWNGSRGPVDLTGWTLTDTDAHTFTFPSVALPAGAYLVVTSASTGADDLDASDGLATLRAGRSGRFGTTYVWNDGGDDVHLRDSAGNTVDWLAYGSGSGIDPAPAGEWIGPYPLKAGAGQSLARFPNGGDDTATLIDWALRPRTQGTTNGLPPVPPTAVAGASIVLREGETAALDASASAAAAGATLVSYEWDFGDGTRGSGERVSHTFADDGELQVVLTVTDSNGVSSLAGLSAQVSNTPPAVTLASSHAAYQGVELVLGASVVDVAADLPPACVWDLGDGSPAAAGASVAHVYTALGTFTATLTATDKDGGRTVATTSVVVTRPSAPYLSSVTPATGTQAGGTRVTITGYRLAGATVTFGGVPATVVSVSTAATPTTSQTLQCLSPPGLGRGLVDVRVVTAGGQYTRTRIFGYADPLPTITAVSPGSAPTGAVTPVTIAGTGFFQVGGALPAVLVGGRAATISSVTPTSIVCVFPDDLSGPKDVVVTNPDGQTTTLAAGFERRVGPRLELTPVQAAVAGYAIEPALTVRVADASGATITTATTAITIGLDSNPTGATLSGSFSATPVNGVATFPGLALDRAGAGYTLRAAAGTLSGESATFEVQGPPARLVFRSQPATVEIGATSIPRQPPLSVEVHDASGRPIVGGAVAVTLSVSGGATLSGATTLVTTRGTVTFTDLSLARAGVGYVLTARAGALSATSDPFDVLAGPAAKLVFLTSPGNGASGVALRSAPVVGARDLAGNAIVTTATITLSVPRTAPQGALFGTWAAPADGRSATFPDLRIMAAGGYTLIASAPGFASATSRPFSVAPGAPSRLAFKGQPTLSEPGLPIWPPVRVVVQDAAGNDVAAVASDVTITLGADPGGALLSGTTTATPVNGVAAFADLVLDRIGWEYDLVASADGLASATSAPFDIEGSLFRFKAATPAVSGPVVGSVAIGDLDGDGLGDVVTTLPEEDAISIRRSAGAARFDPDRRVSVGRSPAGVVIADLNDDGWPDIAVADPGSYDVAVLLATGGGAFAAPHLVGVGRPVSLLVAGDVDGDGRVDLAGSSGDSEVVVLFQTAVGTLALPRAFPAANGRVQRFALADIDRDGALDLVVAQRAPSAVLITYGDGRGGFSGTTSLAATLEPFWIGAADQTRDGFPEVVLLQDDPLQVERSAEVVTFPNRRNRTFGAPLRSARTHEPTGVAFDDVTGDGIADVLVTYNVIVWRGVALFPGRPTGSFATPVTTELRGVPTSVTAGDVNGDGLADLALSISLAQGQSYPPPRAVDVALSIGDGTFALAPEQPLGDRDPRRLTAGDITGDGRLDLVATARGGGSTILLGLAGDTFRGSYFSAGTLTHPPAESLLHDFNGDGRSDLVTILQTPGEVTHWRATGSTSLLAYRTTHALSGQPEAVASGDLDGDGRHDLVVADSTGFVWTLRGRTGVAFDPPRSFPAGAGARSLALADVTGDGRLDAVVVTDAGVLCLAGAGGGAFSPPSQVVLQGGLGLVRAADLSGDGLADLVLISPPASGATTGTAVILYATGQGLFQPGASLTLGPTPRDATLRDLDRDGVPELVVTNGVEHDVSIFPGRRGQPFADARRFPTGLNAYGLVVADLNADGRLDIVTSNCTGHPSATVLFGR